MSVVIETTIGDITVDLYMKERPNTCLNFLKLCKIKYYNLCLFHKIEKNFIAQSGDPSGTGRGGESVFCHLYGDQAKYFDSETKPRLKHEKLGTISMVNNGNNMNGSQFFITLGENLTYLDELHTVFGEVVEGFDILLKLNDAICDGSNRPYQDIRITHTVVLHDPYEDPSGLVIPDQSPEPTKEQLDSGYIAADEEIDDTKGKTSEEIEESIKESEAKARATILEMVGDIPDADVKPPENVLFVCKLNPVTTSEDLEIIFSRFGPILSCEVIKDKKTGESLQYAFIEFEKEEDCENAFFKMDNVLIDDRRIHVDFSQSVSKMYWEKGSKFPKSKFPQQNVVIKDKTKSDGYDLIFDVNNSPVGSTSTHKKHKKNRSRSPRHKHLNSSKTNQDQYRSRSPEGRKNKRYNDSPSKDHHSSYRNYSNNGGRSPNSTRRNEKESEYSSSRYRRSSSRDKYHKNVSYGDQNRSSYKNDYKGKNSKHEYKVSKYKDHNDERLNTNSLKESEYSKKYSKRTETSATRYRHDSVSPVKEKQKYYEDQQKLSYEQSNRTKYIDDKDEQKRDKKCKSSHKESRKDSDSLKTASDTLEKTSRRKKVRSSSTSSSSSSSSMSTQISVKKKSKKSYTSSEMSNSDDSYKKSKKKKHKAKSSKESNDKKKKHKKRKYV